MPSSYFFQIFKKAHEFLLFYCLVFSLWLTYLGTSHFDGIVDGTLPLGSAGQKCMRPVLDCGIFLAKKTPEIRKFCKYFWIVMIFLSKAMRDPDTCYWFPLQMTNLRFHWLFVG